MHALSLNSKFMTSLMLTRKKFATFLTLIAKSNPALNVVIPRPWKELTTSLNLNSRLNRFDGKYSPWRKDSKLTNFWSCFILQISMLAYRLNEKIFASFISQLVKTVLIASVTSSVVPA